MMRIARHARLFAKLQSMKHQSIALALSPLDNDTYLEAGRVNRRNIMRVERAFKQAGIFYDPADRGWR